MSALTPLFEILPAAAAEAIGTYPASGVVVTVKFNIIDQDGTTAFGGFDARHWSEWASNPEGVALSSGETLNAGDNSGFTVMLLVGQTRAVVEPAIFSGPVAATDVLNTLAVLHAPSAEPDSELEVLWSANPALAAVGETVSPRSIVEVPDNLPVVSDPDSWRGSTDTALYANARALSSRSGYVGSRFTTRSIIDYLRRELDRVGTSNTKVVLVNTDVLTLVTQALAYTQGKDAVVSFLSTVDDELALELLHQVATLLPPGTSERVNALATYNVLHAKRGSVNADAAVTALSEAQAAKLPLMSHALIAQLIGADEESVHRFYRDYIDNATL